MHKLFALLCLVFSSTKPSEIPIQFRNQYISGLIPDYNFCQIFRPVGGSSGGPRYFQGARPVSNVSEHVRYIVIHKCRSTIKSEFYQPFVNQAYECEDTDFVQVITVIDLLFY